MANKSQGMPQQQPAWDAAPEGDPRLVARARMGQQQSGPINPQLLRLFAPQGTVRPAVMSGPPIWQTQPKQKIDAARVAPINNPFAEGGY